MITEMLIAGVGFYTYSWLNDTWKRKIKKEFEKTMEGIGLYNKKEETFSILEVEKMNYGYKTLICIPKGLSLDHLMAKQNIIEDNMNAIIEISKNKFSKYAVMYIVDKDVAKYKYSPVKCEEWRLWIGKDIKGQDYFLDLNKDPHILVGGCTGTGKSFLLAAILTNAIYYNSKNIEIYLSQIVKGEVGAFSKCPGVKFTAYSIEEVRLSLKKVCNILDNRSQLFVKCGIKNITQWNKHYKRRKLKRIIYVLEELSFFMEHEDVWEMILKIAKAGRSVGIHLIGLLQRSTATNLNTDCKSQMSKITFKQKSSIDSTNIIGIPDATKLKSMECIVDSNDGIVNLKTSWIDEDFYLLNKYVPEIAIPIKKSKDVDKKIIEEATKTINKLPAKTNIKKEKEVYKKKKRCGVISLEDLKNDN